MLAPLLAALEFRCNNSAYRPVMDAIDLLARYAGADSDQKLYAAGEKVPVDGVVPKAWLDGVTDGDGRVERLPYELCVLIALRDALRRREVYVQGAGRWKDPDEDLPGDFEDNRDVHYAELAKPLDAAEFTGGLQKRLGEGLTRLDTALARGTSGGVRIITRQGSPWVSVPKLGKLPEPRNLGALKAEVERRWGTIDLLDILKDTAFIQPGVTGMLLRGRPDAGPAGTPVGADADQIEGLLAVPGPGSGEVLEEDERGPAPAGELGPDLPGGLGDGRGRPGFGDDGQVARLRPCGQPHAQMGNTLAGHRGRGIAPERVVGDQLAERRQVSGEGRRQHGGGLLSVLVRSGHCSCRDLALASCRETPSCSARLTAVANFGTNATSRSQPLRARSSRPAGWPDLVRSGQLAGQTLAKCERPHVGVSDSVISMSVHWSGRDSIPARSARWPRSRHCGHHAK